MKVAPIIQYINRTSFTTIKNSHFSLVKDTVSFGTKKDVGSFSKAKSETRPEVFERILEYTNEDNFALTKIMLSDKSFPSVVVPNILKNTTEENIESKIEMYNFIKRRKKTLQKDYAEALSSLAYTNQNNIEVHKMMISQKDFPKSIMWSILIPVNEENKDLAELMIKDADFPKERISNILSVINDKNKEVARALIKKKDFPRENIGFVLSNTNQKNSELCLYMLSDCNYAASEIAEVLKMYPEDN